MGMRRAVAISPPCPPGGPLRRPPHGPPDGPPHGPGDGPPHRGVHGPPHGLPGRGDHRPPHGPPRGRPGGPADGGPRGPDHGPTHGPPGGPAHGGDRRPPHRPLSRPPNRPDHGPDSRFQIGDWRLRESGSFAAAIQITPAIRVCQCLSVVDISSFLIPSSSFLSSVVSSLTCPESAAIPFAVRFTILTPEETR